METKHHWPRGSESEGVCIKCGATIDSTCTKCGQGHHALLTYDTPMEPQQYRPLAPEETIQEGDELRERPNALTDWAVISKLGSVVGLTVKDASIIRPPLQFRRPIPSKSATVESPKELYKCVKCGSHFTDPDDLGMPWTCDNCGNALEPVPTVKESLTTDVSRKIAEKLASDSNHIPIIQGIIAKELDDESSDNSRSFQEIERLKLELSELKRVDAFTHRANTGLALEVQKTREVLNDVQTNYLALEENLAAMKLRAERAEAELNENGKILEHLQTQRDTAYNARDGIAELYTKECELRRQAERERDEAREYNQIAEANAAHADARIEALQKERDALRAENETLRNAQKAYDFATVGEVARLREALEEMLSYFDNQHRCEWLNESAYQGVCAALTKAKAALAGKGEAKC